MKRIKKQVEELIEEVVIDMNKGYLKAVKKVFGEEVKVVIDKFHVIYYANRKIEDEKLFIQSEERVKIKKYLLLKNKEEPTLKQKAKIERIFKKHPRLRLLYTIKERIRDMYKSKDKKAAQEKLNSIISSLKSTYDGELITYDNTFSYFKPYILNYFDKRSTNAYMEGVNTLIKLIKRISFGFKSKENFVDKIIISVLLFSSLYPH